MGSNVTITSKGQMTIPKDLREQLNIRPGDKCYAWVRDGELVVIPRNKPIRELASFFGQPDAERTLSQEDIDEAVMDTSVERFEQAAGRSGDE